VIRPLTAADAAAFRDLRNEALGRHPDAFMTSLEEGLATPVEKLATRIGSADSDNFVFGAFTDDGAMVGYVGFERESRAKARHKGKIVGMYVHPALRGSGAGRALMQAALARACDIEGLRIIVLTVTDGNDAARLLYESCGFDTFGIEPDAMFVEGRYFAKRHMVLRVNESG
jgi:ribosomal protein S18 acetylase RimI-like enzyme